MEGLDLLLFTCIDDDGSAGSGSRPGPNRGPPRQGPDQEPHTGKQQPSSAAAAERGAGLRCRISQVVQFTMQEYDGLAEHEFRTSLPPPHDTQGAAGAQ